MTIMQSLRAASKGSIDAPLTEAAGSVVSLAAGVWRRTSIADPPDRVAHEWTTIVISDEELRMIEAGQQAV
jgi:hypothetical protein